MKVGMKGLHYKLLFESSMNILECTIAVQATFHFATINFTRGKNINSIYHTTHTLAEKYRNYECQFNVKCDNVS